MADDRQTGRTTDQMIAAAEGSLFIWCNSALDYPRALARRLGRRDLFIVGPDDLDRRGDLRRRWPAIVVDHAVYFTDRQRAAYRMFLSMVNL